MHTLLLIVTACLIKEKPREKIKFLVIGGRVVQQMGSLRRAEWRLG